MRGLVLYTVLRLAIFGAIWLLVQVVTPMRGWLALAVAVLISGMISFIALDRPRDVASVGLSGWFRRMNERIEANTVKEDVDVDLDVDEGAGGATPADPAASGASQAEDQTEEHRDPVRQGEEPRPRQDRNEVTPDSTA